MSGSAEVSVPERGAAQIDRATWALLSSSQDFWRAVDDKLFAVEAARGATAVLRGRMYVGSITCGEVQINLVEKVQGVVDALLEDASPLVRPHQGVLSEGTRWVDQLLLRFLLAVEDYVAGGREWEYATSSNVSPTVKGRLLVPQTLRLRAAGARHLLASEQVLLKRQTPFNTLIAVTLLEAEALGQAGLISDSSWSKARSMWLLFQDSLTWSARVEGKGVWVRRAGEMVDSRTGAASSIASLASSILSMTAERAEGAAVDAPFAWLLNLEVEFEKAIRNRVGQALGGRYSVSKPAAPSTLFADALRLIPDLVTINRTNGLRTIGDVKYKAWDGGYNASDVYQLVTHAAALGAHFAYLVYPADSFARRDLGASKLGVSVTLFGVSVTDLRAGAYQIAEAIENLESGLPRLTPRSARTAAERGPDAPQA